MLRKRFQIHLSTALILMVGCGLLLWANLHAPYSYSGPLEKRRNNSFYAFRHYGWPFTAIVKVEEVRNDAGKDTVTFSGYDAFSYRLIAYNAGVALAILAGVGYACEKIGRRGFK